MRGNVHGDHLAGAGPRTERPLRRRRGGEPGDRRDRPQQGNDRRQVIRRDVEQRPAAGAVEHLGIRVPAVWAAHEHRRGSAERDSDRAFFDQAPSRLVGAAEERVGCATEAQPALLGVGDELPALGARGGQRLLRIDVLAGSERRANERRMRLRRRQVEHQLDLGIGDQLVDSQ